MQPDETDQLQACLSVSSLQAEPMDVRAMTADLELQTVTEQPRVKPIDLWTECKRPSCTNWAEWAVLDVSGLFYNAWCTAHMPKGKR